MRVLTIFMTTALLALGCDREPDPLPTPPPPGAPAVEGADAEAADERQTYVAALERQLEALRPRIERLREQAATAGQSAQAAMDKAVAELNELAAKAKASAEQLKTATGEKWEAAKAESMEITQRLKAAYAAAVEAYQRDPHADPVEAESRPAE